MDKARKKHRLSKPKKCAKLSALPDWNVKLSKDSYIALQIFPEEIWLKVLEGVVEAEALENLSNASPFFRNRLLPIRVQFLFGKVWNKLVSHVDNNHAEHHGRILDLRSVCRAWCEGIDVFYQNLPQQYEMKMRPSKNRTEPWKLDQMDNLPGSWAMHKLEFSTKFPEMFRDFLRHFEPTHFSGKYGRNPFFTRDITIERTAKQLDFNFTSVDALLQKYGHHVWYCTIYIREHYPEKVEYYQRLRHLLVLVPNLRLLYIKYQSNPIVYHENGIRCFAEDYPSLHAEHQELIKEIESNGLPTFQNLTLLRTWNVPVAIFNELICKNAHVSKLQIQRKIVHENYDIYSIPMLNLRKLYVQYFSQADFQNLNNTQVNWPLESLYLDFEDYAPFDWSEIFRVLENKWGKSVVDLMINLPKEKVKDEEILRNCSTYMLKMEKVKKLVLVTTNHAKLDISLQLRNSLEILDVTIRHEDLSKVNMEEKIYNNQEGTIYDALMNRPMITNIWELMPNLSVFKVSYESVYNEKPVKFCETRKDWIHKIEGKKEKTK